MTVDAERPDFCKFLQRLVATEVDIDDWNRFAIRPSRDSAIEAARRRLIAFALNVGQCSAKPTPEGIEKLAATLLDELT
ncbi:MAG: hypothetical protein ABL888_21745 [Pirellulaceae bacterium]